jgi:hypothetical protein
MAPFRGPNAHTSERATTPGRSLGLGQLVRGRLKSPPEQGRGSVNVGTIVIAVLVVLGILFILTRI